MKILNYIKISAPVIIVLFITVFTVSCNEDEGGSKKIVVKQVFLQSVENPDSVVTIAGTGGLIRIDGEGFSTLRAVYCNGVEATVNPTFVTEHSILFRIPSAPAGGHADEEVRNTIRLVTDFDDYTFTFDIHSSRPVANGDSYKIGVDKTLTVMAEDGVLANDTDAEDDPLTAILDSTTVNGSLVLNEDGSFEYIPDTGFEGTDRFTYYANDGMINSSSRGVVTIIVSNSSIVNGVSHTFPKVGETIVIYGADFEDVTRIVFPGDIDQTEFTVNEAKTEITCVVPAGITKGAIMVDGSAGTAYSHNYMFRDECRIVNWSWGQGYGGSYGSLSALSNTTTANIPAGGDPSSPEVGYRHCPNTPPPSTTTLPVSNDAAFGFNFNPATAAQTVINNSGGLITSSTNCTDLALQMDFYVSVPWGSGYFQVNLKPGTESYSGKFVPQWATIGGGQDITMTGWHTATLPLENVSALQSETLQHFINELTSNGNFTFVNNNYTLNGTTYTAKSIDNFQIFIGNFRLVPYVKPE